MTGIAVVIICMNIRKLIYTYTHTYMYLIYTTTTPVCAAHYMYILRDVGICTVYTQSN